MTPATAGTIRVARFGLFEETKFGLFSNWLALKFVKIYQVVGFLKKYLEAYIVKYKNFSFLKQSLAFFSYKHLATLGTMYSLLILRPVLKTS